MAKPLEQRVVNQIYTRIDKGLGTTQIAKEVEVSRETVRKYRNNRIEETPPKQPDDFAPEINPVEERDQEMRTLRHTIVAGITALLGLIWWTT